jgi:cytochrome P450
MVESVFDYRTSSISRGLQGEESPQPTYKELADSRLNRWDGAVNLFRYDDIVKINRDTTVRGTGGSGVFYLGSERPRIPQDIDGPEHTQWRRLLDPLFSPKQVALLSDDIVRLANELIDGFIADGQVELYSQFCTPLPVAIFLQMMGIPAAGNMAMFMAFKDGTLHPKGETAEELTAYATEAGKPLNAFLRTLFRERRGEEPKNDLIGALMEAEVGGELLTDELLVDIVYELLLAGLDSITSTLSVMISWLARHPDTRARLVADPSLWPAAIEELLRFETPIPAQPRFATEDVDLGDGVVVGKGEPMQVLVAAANMDSTKFENPLTVDIDRPRNAHLAFSSGIHRCLGSHLARLELRLALQEFHRRLPEYRISEGESPVYNNTVIRAATHLPLTFPAAIPAAVRP